MTITIPLKNHTKNEVQNEVLKSFATWGALIPHLNTIFTIKETEEIIGLEIDEDGVLAVIKRKK